MAKFRSAVPEARSPTVLLRTELGPGHRGSTGRYDAWRDEARIQAFILTQVGLGCGGRAVTRNPHGAFA